MIQTSRKATKKRGLILIETLGLMSLVLGVVLVFLSALLSLQSHQKFYALTREATRALSDDIMLSQLVASEMLLDRWSDFDDTRDMANPFLETKLLKGVNQGFEQVVSHVINQKILSNRSSNQQVDWTQAFHMTQAPRWSIKKNEAYLDVRVEATYDLLDLVEISHRDFWIIPIKVGQTSERQLMDDLVEVILTPHSQKSLKYHIIKCISLNRSKNLTRFTLSRADIEDHVLEYRGVTYTLCSHCKRNKTLHQK